MRVGVLGTGMVGRAIASKLVDLGHDVLMGSRSAGNESAVEWAEAGQRRRPGDVRRGGCARRDRLQLHERAGVLDALAAAGAENLAGKVLVDVSNALDTSRGMPPSLFVSGTDSLGERIQRFPDARVVVLNTVNCEVMVDPAKVPGEHDVFVCGDDESAKAAVVGLLQASAGRRSVLDLGDITSSRGVEAYVLLWIRLWGHLQTGYFNVRVVH